MKTEYLTGNYADMRRKVYQIKNEYPFSVCSVCARSWGGRAIFTLGIGNPDNTVIYTGCINATHVKSSFELLKVFENICKAYRNNERICGIRLNDLFQSKGVIFIPCLNPDGMEMQQRGAVAAGCYAGLVQRLCTDSFDTWRSNAAGTDLNHNISGNWHKLKKLEMNLGYTSPGARFYGGKTCISEPETRAFAKLCREHHVRHIMTVGCGKSRIISSALEDEKQALMLKIFGLCSGYETAIYDRKGIEEHNGLVDWFSSEFNRPAFGIEIDEGVDFSYSSLEEICVLSAIM